MWMLCFFIICLLDAGLIPESFSRHRVGNGTLVCGVADAYGTAISLVSVVWHDVMTVAVTRMDDINRMVLILIKFCFLCPFPTTMSAMRKGQREVSLPPCRAQFHGALARHMTIKRIDVHGLVPDVLAGFFVRPKSLFCRFGPMFL